jgi:hypothetical protein
MNRRIVIVYERYNVALSFNGETEGSWHLFLFAVEALGSRRVLRAWGIECDASDLGESAHKSHVGNRVKGQQEKRTRLPDEVRRHLPKNDQ